MAKKIEGIEKEKPVPQEGSKMLITQYFHWFRPEVHPYHRAYVAERYDDTLKTEKEWAKELKVQIGG